MPSTAPRSTPSRVALRSNTQSSGPVSNIRVRLSPPVFAVIRQESPCAAQQRHDPDSHFMPCRCRKANSVSTNPGLEDRLSVTLSTSTMISSCSTAFMSSLVSCLSPSAQSKMPLPTLDRNGAAANARRDRTQTHRFGRRPLDRMEGRAALRHPLPAPHSRRPWRELPCRRRDRGTPAGQPDRGPRITTSSKRSTSTCSKAWSPCAWAPSAIR